MISQFHFHFALDLPFLNTRILSTDSALRQVPSYLVKEPDVTDLGKNLVTICGLRVKVRPFISLLACFRDIVSLYHRFAPTQINDICTLRQGAWLNDVIINSYFAALHRLSIRGEGESTLRVWFVCLLVYCIEEIYLECLSSIQFKPHSFALSYRTFDSLFYLRLENGRGLSERSLCAAFKVSKVLHCRVTMTARSSYSC